LGNADPDWLLNTSSPRAGLRGVNTLQHQPAESVTDQAALGDDITSAARSRLSRTLAEVPAARVAGALVNGLGLELLCVWEDFSCGRDREGDPAFVRALGLVVHIHSFVHDADGMKVSSSRLRELNAAASRAPFAASARLTVDA